MQPSAETLVAMQTADGFRVYAPSDPGRTFLVSGTADVPDCTCSEFKEMVGADPDFRCRHILAVESQLPQPTPLDDEEREERRAIQAEGAAPTPAMAPVALPGAQMTIKRSASPDGRIDSLSVEFTCPVEGLTQGTIKAKAEKTIRLQEAIVADFLAANANGNGDGEDGNGHDDHGRNGGNGRESGGQRAAPVSARMIDVQGMQTRFGWRLFINIESAGQTYKLFGTRRELGDAIAAAGYPDLSRNLASGTELNIPCRVTFKRSDDNRYQNVDQVFAADEGARGRGRR